MILRQDQVGRVDRAGAFEDLSQIRELFVGVHAEGIVAHTGARPPSILDLENEIERLRRDHAFFEQDLPDRLPPTTE